MKRGASAARLKELRRKYGLGEFRSKGHSVGGGQAQSKPSDSRTSRTARKQPSRPGQSAGVAFGNLAPRVMVGVRAGAAISSETEGVIRVAELPDSGPVKIDVVEPEPYEPDPIP